MVLICDLTIPQNGGFATTTAYTSKNLYLAVFSFASFIQIAHPSEEKVTNLSLVYVFLSIISSSIMAIFFEKQRVSWYAAPAHLKVETTVGPLLAMIYSLIIMTERMDSIEDAWGFVLHRNLRKIATLPDNASLLSEASRLSLTQLLTKRSLRLTQPSSQPTSNRSCTWCCWTWDWPSNASTPRTPTCACCWRTSCVCVSDSSGAASSNSKASSSSELTQLSPWLHCCSSEPSKPKS